MLSLKAKLKKRVKPLKGARAIKNELSRLVEHHTTWAKFNPDLAEATTRARFVTEEVSMDRVTHLIGEQIMHSIITSVIAATGCPVPQIICICISPKSIMPCFALCIASHSTLYHLSECIPFSIT